MITEAQKAWMAGVLDLKGRISVKATPSRRDKQYTWHVDSKEILVVRKLCEYTASQPEDRQQRTLSEMFRRNCTLHCPEAHIHVEFDWNMPRVLRWTASGGMFAILHHNLKPYMQVDRGEQETVDLILQNPTTEGRGSHIVLARAAQLQALGWELIEPYNSALSNRVTAALEAEEEEDGKAA